MTFWGDRFKREEDLPEELRGKDPKDVAAALKKAADDATALQTATDARKASDDALTVKNTEFETMKAKLAELEAGNSRQQQQQQEQVVEPPSPWTDPQGFVQDQTKGIANTALMAGMMTAKMYCRENLNARDLKIFKKYDGEIVQLVGNSAPEQRVMPQTWFNMLMYVKGVHDNDIKKSESEGTDFFSETVSRGGQPDSLPADKLTDEEAEICKKFHYDPVKYLAQKKSGVTLASERGSYARYPVPTKS